VDDWLIRPARTDPSLPAPTHRFHLLSLTDFTPHPLAHLPVLDFPPFLQPVMQTRQLLQIMGDHLIILVSRFASQWIFAGVNMVAQGVGGGMGRGNEEEIIAWNWKTGGVLAVSRCGAC
jgi:hypothetical protein